MEVIDIPSSPEPLPVVSRVTRSQSRQPVSQKRRAPPPARRVAEEIIEISDSDSESTPKPVTPKGKRPAHRTQEISTASGPSFPNVPVFGPSGHLLHEAAAAPSAGPSDNDRITAAPLFYPDNEDSQVQDVPVRNEGLENPPGPVLPLVLPPAAPPQPPQPPEPPEPPAPVVDPTDACVARVLEIVPDVQPTHVLGLVEQFFQHNPANAGQNVLELVLHSLFENPDYPKVDKKGKRKRTEDDEEGSARGQPVPKIDYGTKDREHKGGLYYFELALNQLMVDFPYVPKPYLRMRLLENRFYAPTHLLLGEQEKQDSPPYARKSVPSRVSGKGKAKFDAEFEAERQWLLQQQDAHISTDGAHLEATNGDDNDDCEDGIECGCCFASYPFEKMVQCPEAHLFCTNCMSSYASNLLGEHNPNIVCMDQTGCKRLFPESELERFLTPKLLELYHRVKQRKEIEAAGLENLEECPFCDYKCVIDNEMEKLFRCENVDCGAVSCRECKQPDHLPKSCKEVESDKQLDVQHVVEEAMTRALMRNCPKCQKAFVKEHGCNKMICPNCHTTSCYICRKVINGYEHFGTHGGRANKTQCQLWDQGEQLHAKEVQEAAKKAIEELKRDHPNVDASNIKVDIPVADTAQSGLNLNQHQPLPVNPWGIPAFPNMYQPMPAFGAGAAVDMLDAQRQFQRELEEQHARLILEQAARRQRTMADIQGNMYMAVPMPPLPPIPQVQPLRHQLHYQPLQHQPLHNQPLHHPMLRPPVMPRLPPVPLPVAARRRSRKH